MKTRQTTERKPIEKESAIKLFKLGYNKKFIANKLNVTEKTVAKWVNGQTKIDEHYQIQINELKAQVERLVLEVEKLKNRIQ